MLPTIIEQSVEQYIESINLHMESVLENDLADNSDNLWDYFANLGEHFAYSDGDFIRCIERQLELCEGIVPIPQGITKLNLINACRELLEFNADLYCNAVANDSYYSHKDSVLSLPVGELEYSLPDEFEADSLPEWIVDKINRSTDYTYNRGYLYVTLLSVELRLVKPVDLISDAIEQLTSEE